VVCTNKILLSYIWQQPLWRRLITKVALNFWTNHKRKNSLSLSYTLSFTESSHTHACFFFQMIFYSSDSSYFLHTVKLIRNNYIASLRTYNFKNKYCGCPLANIGGSSWVGPITINRPGARFSSERQKPNGRVRLERPWPRGALSLSKLCV
jgi:hypothetical protein